MPFEECRPLNGGMAECGGFFVVAPTKLALGRSDGSRRAGTTSRRASRWRIRPFAAAAGLLDCPLRAKLATFTRPPLRRTYLFRSISVLSESSCYPLKP